MQLWKFSLVKLLRWKPAILHVHARYYAHSVFVLKTTPFATPLFSTNDHLLGSSVVIFLKILGDLAKSMPCQTVLKMTCGRLNLRLFRSTVQACFYMYPHRRPCRCAVFANICLFWSFTFFLILIAARLNFKTTWPKETTASPDKSDKKVFPPRIIVGSPSALTEILSRKFVMFSFNIFFF